MGLSVSIFGLGYVGSVSAACFASMGHKVIGVDVSRAKVEMLDSGRTPIVEARMAEMVAEANKSCRLHARRMPSARSEFRRVVCMRRHAQPEEGKLDLSHIESVAREIGAAIRQKKVHTFLSCGARSWQGRPKASCFDSRKGKRKQCGRDFTVCYNPNSCVRVAQ